MSIGKLWRQWWSFRREERTTISLPRSEEDNTLPAPPGRVFYKISPAIFYLRKNRDRVLARTLNMLQDWNLFPLIGLELEFSAITDLNSLRKAVQILIRKGIKVITLVKEVGWNQFEVDLEPYGNVFQLLEDVEILQSFLKKEFIVDFSAISCWHQPYSALHINITLNDTAGNNLFKRITPNQESELLKNSVAGLIFTTNGFLPLYINTLQDLLIYDYQRNATLYGLGYNPAPTYNCWGFNNRSCSIRIPAPKNILEDRSRWEFDRRLEFKVPTASCCVREAILGVLLGIVYGLRHKLVPPMPTSNNVLLHHDGFHQIMLENCSWDFFDLLP